MRKVRYTQSGEKFYFSPLPSPVHYPDSEVQPDQSLSIRQIYERWSKNQPTTVHPFVCEFDDDADNIDYDDEFPIDRSQLENKVENLKDVAKAEIEEKRQRRKDKKAQEKEQENFIEKLAQKLPFADKENT